MKPETKIGLKRQKPQQWVAGSCLQQFQQKWVKARSQRGRGWEFFWWQGTKLEKQTLEERVKISSIAGKRREK